MGKAVELATALNTAWVHTTKATALRCRTSSNENELALLVPTSTSRVITRDVHPATAFRVTSLDDSADTHSVRSSKSHKFTHSISSTNLHGWHASPQAAPAGVKRHTNTVTGTDTVFPTSAKIVCVCNAIPPETQLVLPPLSLLMHLKAATVFNLRAGLPKDLLLPPTITAMDGSRSRIHRRTPPMGSRPSPSPRVIPTCRRSSPCTLSPLLLLLAHRTLSRAP